MTETGRPLLLAFALSLAGSATAMADGGLPSAEGELACSVLCRSWMNIGRAEPQALSAAPAAQGAVGATPAAPSAAPPPKVRVAVQPKTRTTDRPRRAASAAVPLPAPRPAPEIARPARIAVAEERRSAARPAIDPPHVMQVAAPVAAESTPPVVELSKPTPQVEAASVTPPPVAPGPIAPTLAPPGRTLDEAPASAPVAVPPPMGGTPWSVRLCFYAVLAALAGLGFRPRRPTGAAPEAEQTARRRASAGFGESRAQHAGVDAL